MKKLLSIFFIFFLHLQLVQAQGTLEVVSKTVEKKIPYNSSGTIVIVGENSTVKINSWSKDEVLIKIKLIAKHRTKSIAIAEVDKIIYTAEKLSKDIFLKNSFLEKTEQAAGVILKVQYELIVPIKSNISIKNNLGNIEIDNIEGNLSIDAKFGNINLNGVSGTATINVSLGDIDATKILGTSKINASHSSINMTNLSGKHTIKLVNGDLLFQPSGKVDLVNIEAKNGNVNLVLSPNDAYNYSFDATYGEIVLPELFKSKINSGKDKSTFLLYNKNIPAFINAKCEFGNITLKNK